MRIRRPQAVRHGSSDAGGALCAAGSRELHAGRRGSCWTSSIAAPFRADAWRCAVGNGIQDPCFQIGGSTSTLLCGIDPQECHFVKDFRPFAYEAASGCEREFRYRRPGPIGRGLSSFRTGRSVRRSPERCPSPQDGEVALYGCAPRYKGDDRMIFGNFDTSSEPWTAEVGTLSASTSTFPPPMVASSVVPVATIWQ